MQNLKNIILCWPLAHFCIKSDHKSGHTISAGKATCLAHFGHLATFFSKTYLYSKLHTLLFFSHTNWKNITKVAKNTQNTPVYLRKRAWSLFFKSGHKSDHTHFYLRKRLATFRDTFFKSGHKYKEKRRALARIATALLQHRL